MQRNNKSWNHIIKPNLKNMNNKNSKLDWWKNKIFVGIRQRKASTEMTNESDWDRQWH